MAVFEKERTDAITFNSGKTELIQIAADAKAQSEMVRKNVNELYINKHSPIREIVSNAIDAAIDAKEKGLFDESKPLAVIEYIQQGYFGDPCLVIKDYGTGMSEDTLFGLYRYFGTSSRNHSNNTIGAFGIGSKSPLKIAPQFVVKTDDGVQETTVRVGLNEQGLYEISILSKKESSQRGTEVSIPLKNMGSLSSRSYHLNKLYEREFSIDSITSFIEDVFVLFIARREIEVKNLDVKKYTIREETEDYVIFNEIESPSSAKFIGSLLYENEENYYTINNHSALIKFKPGIEAKPNLSREEIDKNYVGSCGISFNDLVSKKTELYENRVQELFFEDIKDSDLEVLKKYLPSKIYSIKIFVDNFEDSLYKVMPYRKGYRADRPSKCIRRINHFIADTAYYDNNTQVNCYFEDSLQSKNVLAWLDDSTVMCDINAIKNEEMKALVKRSIPSITSKQIQKLPKSSRQTSNSEISCKLLVEGSSYDWRRRVTFVVDRLSIEDFKHPEKLPYRIIKCTYDDQDKMNRFSNYMNSLINLKDSDGKRFKVFKFSKKNYQQIDALHVFDESLINYVSKLEYQRQAFDSWTQELNVFKPYYPKLKEAQSNLKYNSNLLSDLLDLQKREKEEGLKVSPQIKKDVEEYCKLKEKYKLLSRMFNGYWGSDLDSVNKLIKNGF